MKCIDEIPASELKGKRVLVRNDFNLPLDAKGNVADVFRLKQGWKTIQYLSERGARVISISHIGREGDSIEPVAREMKKLGRVFFIPDIAGRVAQEAVATMKDGDIALLENVRRDAREKENEESFARELASLADIYVDDAFAAAHRTHASIAGVPKFLPSYAGFLMRDEVTNIDAARSPEHPSLAILGGAKFETKAPLIRLLLEKYDHLFITGALANDVFKARGLPVGRSLISKELPGEDILSNPHFLAPADVTVERPDGQVHVKKPEEVGAEDKIVDIGPATVAMLSTHIANAKFILWAGPTGMYENGYIHYTQGIAELIAKSDAKKVIGGGDTIAAIEATGVPQEKLGFLSTGGGAMLEYLLKGTLPGVEALQ
ncbi:phosphoglycerate kinase [Candidatus Kaiserbacteria bacterium RIFCSPHIGHO2_02_FULL_54_11b]|uniref:Phosphoglycerate kinase n=2 Tax=Candidatus Kaiseribacteriota TaxID=1752734 RepID=A0A1F6CPZ8_9BACT|nr:MAG: phosphoglycerate kinase [Candidatus Kaiserbacteria bacterium RIFCSPHIGHO2_01_FULL_54_36b]OGG64308.1 MAG: phosphoglycerate kinase [Candidatus Kaiserbacteria bacterium RIFCSPHIGHO2_02_FULL_54_11b]